MSEDLDDRLTAGIVNAEGHVETVEELRQTADTVGTEFQQSLPTHTGDWDQSTVTDYISRLRETVNKPQIAQSKAALEEVGFDETQIGALPEDELKNKDAVTTIRDHYGALSEKFGDAVVEFLVDEELILDWIRSDGAGEAASKLDITDESKYETLTNLDHLPDEVISTYFRGILEESRNTSEAQDLNQHLETLENAGVDTTYEGDLGDFETNAASGAEYYNELQSEYGYDTGTINDWVDGENLESAASTLQTKHDEAGTKRGNLRDEIEEYCHLLDKDVPDIDPIPELEEKAEELRRELNDTLGPAGEQLLNYFRGESGELPEDLGHDDLVEGIERIRPIIKERFGGQS